MVRECTTQKFSHKGVNGANSHGVRIGSAALTGTATKIAATDVAMSANMVGTRCRALGLKCTNVG